MKRPVGWKKRISSLNADCPRCGAWGCEEGSLPNVEYATWCWKCNYCGPFYYRDALGLNEPVQPAFEEVDDETEEDVEEAESEELPEDSGADAQEECAIGPDAWWNPPVAARNVY